MGLLPDQLLQDRLKNQVNPPTPTAVQPPSPQDTIIGKTGIPVTPQEQDQSLGEKIENFFIKPINAAQSFVHRLVGEPSKSEEDQVKEFRGKVGSIEYQQWQANHPIRAFGPLQIAKTIGMDLPDQETWDRYSENQKGALLRTAAVAATGKMVLKLPREIIKAPIRLAGSILRPWVSWAQTGKIPTIEDLSGEETVKLPFLGNVPTYWKTFGDARKSGLGPIASVITTGSLAIGDVAISSVLTEAMAKAFQPRIALKPGEQVVNVKPIEKAIIEEKGKLKFAQRSAESPNEYYSLPASVAKQYGGNSQNTFLKMSPAGIIGESSVEVSIVQTRGGVLQKGVDLLKRRGERIYDGDFGPEIKFQSQTIKAGKSFLDDIPSRTFSETEESGILSSILPKPLKGFEKDPITRDQIVHLDQLSKVNGIPAEMTNAIIRNVTGKSIIGELTQIDYVKISQTLGAFNKLNKFTDGDVRINMASQYLSPQRYFMRGVEQQYGIPIYSDIYVPMEEGIRLRNIFRDSYRNESRELFGKYAESGFAEERRLIKHYIEGDTASITTNKVLDTATKTDLIKIADGMRNMLERAGQTFGVSMERFGRNYQSHIQDIGGVYQLYKEGMEIPKELTFFGEFQRKGAVGPQIDDSLALFDIYINAGSNKLFLNSVLQKAAALGEKVPAILQNSIKSYVGEKLGYAGRVEQALNDFSASLNKKMGWNLPPDFARQLTQIGMDTTYSGALGGRADALVRNLLQAPLLTYPRLGSRFFAEAFKKGFTKEGMDELINEGFNVKLGVPFGRELAAETGYGGKAGALYRKTTQATLGPYSQVDLITRTTTYQQGKMIWQDALAKYNSGKSSWAQFENDIDMRAFGPIDRNIIRQRLVSGDQKGAFSHYIQDILDSTQFPYRRGSSSRITYGLAGRIGTQFAQWNIEFVHTIGSWVRTGQWDKVIRFWGASTAIHRTMQDVFGLDTKKWIGFGPFAPTLSFMAQTVINTFGLITAITNKNAEEIKANKDDIIRSFNALGKPVGVQLDRWSNFKKSIDRGAIGPNGQYGVYSKSGKLLYWTEFPDLIYSVLLGFPSIKQQQERQFIQEVTSAKLDYSQKKQKALELYQRGDENSVREANKIVEENSITISPSDFDAYFIPFDQRLFEQLPPALKGRFAPKLQP